MSFVQRLLLALFSACYFFSSDALALQLQIDGFDPARHERFYSGADKAFIGDDAEFGGEGLDFSGVGRVVGGRFNVTMISEHYFLSAEHVRPTTQNYVTFINGNSIEGGEEEFHVDSFATSPGAAFGDLWLGKMEVAPPVWVKRYPIASMPNSADWVSLIDPELVTYGFSPDTPNSPSLENVAVGRTRLKPLAKGNGPPSLIYSDTKNTTVVGDKATTIGGDSTSPAFYYGPLGLAIIGTHAGPGSDNNVSFHSEGIISAIAANEIATSGENLEKVVLVPPLLGDLDGNFKVDFSDIVIFSQNYNGNDIDCDCDYFDGDLNQDSRINFEDVVLLSGSYGQQIIPVDFDSDGYVGKSDLITIAQNHGNSVAQFTLGDGTGDGLVNDYDVNLFEAIRLLPFDMPDPIDVFADIDGDMLVSGSDLLIMHAFVIDGDTEFSGYFPSDADLNNDGVTNFSDLLVLSEQYGRTVAMDINLDQLVDAQDLTMLLSQMDGSGDPDFNADFDGDGIVDNDDLLTLIDWWGYNGSLGNNSNAIPEPSTGLLITVLGLSVGCSSGRKRVARTVDRK